MSLCQSAPTPEKKARKLKQWQGGAQVGEGGKKRQRASDSNESGRRKKSVWRQSSPGWEEELTANAKEREVQEQLKEEQAAEVAVLAIEEGEWEKNRIQGSFRQKHGTRNAWKEEAVVVAAAGPAAKRCERRKTIERYRQGQGEWVRAGPRRDPGWIRAGADDCQRGRVLLA
jgi:hypothetical protein